MADKKKKTEEIVGTQPTNEEQMMLRQSAPQPTAMDDAQRMMQGRQIGSAGLVQGMASDGAIDGFRALASPIGKEAIQKATQTLQKYKEGKANLERRIIDNEQWYKLRHWECMRKSENQVQPTSGWLFNCIANKHADAMDNFPSPNVLPRKYGCQHLCLCLITLLPRKNIR